MEAPTPSLAAALVRKFEDNSARVAVVGLGYAGLPLALRYAEAGFNVLGLDISEEKIEHVNAGTAYFGHISRERMAAATSKLHGSTDYALANECDAIILCVPTPLGTHQEPDLSFVRQTIESLRPHVRPGQVVSLESTTYPGTTLEELVVPLQEQGFTVGEDVFVVYSPEREDPGNVKFHTEVIPKIVGGHTPACLQVGMALYSAVVEKAVAVSSPAVAEMAKLLENIYRAVNIGLVNELKTVADSMNLDIWEVIDAAATKPFGFTPFYPGPGLGGHCIPVDPFYLTWKAHEYNIHTRFIELAGQINLAMPEWVITKVIDGLGQQGKPLHGSRVLVLGVAYKKNVDDVRESPSIELMEILRRRGAIVSYSDPHVPVFPEVRHHIFEMSSVELTPENLAQYDCVLLAADHDRFDYELIVQHSRLIVDTRGRYREARANVVKA